MKSLSPSLSPSFTHTHSFSHKQIFGRLKNELTKGHTSYTDIRSNILNLFILISFGLSLLLCYFSINISSNSADETEYTKMFRAEMNIYIKYTYTGHDMNGLFFFFLAGVSKQNNIALIAFQFIYVSHLIWMTYESILIKFQMTDQSNEFNNNKKRKEKENRIDRHL